MLVFAQILVVRCLHSCHFIQNSTDHTVSVCVSKWELLHIKLKTQHNIQPDKDASRKRTRLPSNSSYGSAQAGCKSDTACLRQALPCKFNEGVREKKKKNNWQHNGGYGYIPHQKSLVCLPIQMAWGSTLSWCRWLITQCVTFQQDARHTFFLSVSRVGQLSVYSIQYL